jgi:hypothetical protein
MTQARRRQAAPDDDPAPQAPPEPDLEACCGQGCDPCVFDLYAEARERYEAALRAWQERRRTRSGARRGASGARR